jgi:hypothetical protein
VVKISAQVRSGDARRVAYAWDELDALSFAEP